jgi:hypothetical protein
LGLVERIAPPLRGRGFVQDSIKPRCGATCDENGVPPWTRGDFRGVFEAATSRPSHARCVRQLLFVLGGEDENDEEDDFQENWNL